MEKELEKFMEHITVIDRDYSLYEDKEKGVIFPCNTVALLVKSDYMELTDKEYEGAKFQLKVDDLDYNKITVKRAVPKSEITGNEEDKNVITEQDTEVRQIWNVSNAIGIHKSFNDKDEAIKVAENINSEIFKFL